MSVRTPENPEQVGATVPAVFHRTRKIDGIDIFYREAGPRDAPTVLLLHGFPTSSNQYRKLIPALADKWHVLAPDYPGYGFSGMPDRKDFKYTFENFTNIVETLLGELGIDQYVVYLMDYGSPVGLRLALRHPDSILGLIAQNGNAYEEGLGAFWDPIRTMWKDRNEETMKPLANFVTLEGTKWQYTDGVKDLDRVDPASYTLDQTLMDRPGNAEIQFDVIHDYRTNVDLYPDFQTFFRDRKPPMLIVWGANDPVFPAPGARAYLNDLPDAELHLLDTGHFALEEKSDEMIPLIRDWLDRTLV